jgi:5-methylthioadenosine/S-adenosylhomocysteine deaminase
MNKEVMVLVRGEYVLTVPEELESSLHTDYAVHVGGDRITEIAPFFELREKYPDEEVVGNGKQLVMPGLIDAHSHGRGLSPLRSGLRYDHLEPWLMQTSSLPNPGFYLNALYSGIKHLRSGFTGMHYLHIPRLPLLDMEQDMERALAGLEATGIRFAFSVPIKDQNFFTYDDETFFKMLPLVLRKHVQELVPPIGKELFHSFTQLFSDFYSKYDDSRHRVLLAPAGPQWCSDEVLQIVKDLALKYSTKIHLHTLQTVRQKAYGIRTYGKSLIEHLDDIGLMGPNLTLGHAVWLTTADIDLLAAAGTSVTHHAGCNLNMRNGIAPVDAYLHQGIRVALGLDDKPFSEDEDAFQEMRLIALLHKINTHKLDSDYLRSCDVLRMATENAAEVIGLGASCGRLEPGYFADMILIDLERLSTPWLAPNHDIRDILVHCGLAQDVNTVIVGGKVVIQDGVLLTIDEAEVIADFREALNTHEGGIKGFSVWNEIGAYVYDFYQKWEVFEQAPYYTFNSRT